MLQLAQAMRNINTNKIPTYTIEALGQMIGDQAVLVPKIQNETMRQVLALFQGKAGFTATGVSYDEPTSSESITAMQTIIETVAVANRAIASAPPTTIPVVAPEQNTLGIVPPNDPNCR